MIIGSKVTWLVRVIVWLLFIVTKPISLILDKALGTEIGLVHSKKELLQVRL